MLTFLPIFVVLRIKKNNLIFFIDWPWWYSAR